MVGRRRSFGVLVTALALVFGTGIPAFASHFRASNDTITYASGTLHWTVNEAWRKGSASTLISSAGSVTVSQGGTTTPGVPSSNLTTTTDTTSSPLYDTTVEQVDTDISGILSSPGTYQVYASSCCRIGGVVNTQGNNSFSQAYTFTINPDQSVNLPPRPNAPTLYQLLILDSVNPLSIDYRATDPTGSAVTYSLDTTVGSPDFGADVMPCSTFTSGILTIAASLCTGSDNFTTAYAGGSFYAVKVRAADAQGNYDEVDTLLRVPTTPAPNLASPTVDRGSATFPVTLTDNYATTYTITCTNTGDSSDVVTVTAATPPLVVQGLRPGATYACSTTATNALGTGTSNTRTFTTGSFALQTITFPQPANAHVADATVTLAATASSGLAVTYTSTTPTVCTVAASVVTLVSTGTCTIAADQAGDSGTDLAPTVMQSFSVLPPVPAPGALTSSGLGSATQTVTISVPSGDTATLLDASGNPVSSLTVAGVGTYTMNAATQVVTFVPVDGYSGTAPAIGYRVTDAFGQSGTSTITTTVTKPAAPVTTAKTTRGSGTQKVSVTVPAGDSITLVDAAGNPTDKIVIKGEGTYVLDPVSGVITFTPAHGASGKAKGVHYRVTDLFGQSSTATYTPSLPAAGQPAVKVKLEVKAVTVLAGTSSSVPVTCSMSRGSVSTCTVTLTAKVGGKTVVVGTGKRRVTGTHGSTVVAVKLTAKGKALAAVPGGVTTSVTAGVLPKAATKALSVAGKTRIVLASTPALRPVFFDIDKATLRSPDVAYLTALRRALAGVKSVSCTGFTDNNGDLAYNRDLGQRRADTTCAFLLTGRSIKSVTASYGLDRPHATNDNSAGQALNRRVEIVLHY